MGPGDATRGLPGLSPVKARMAQQGFVPRPSTPEAFQRYIRDETVKFAELIKANNVSVEN